MVPNDSAFPLFSLNIYPLSSAVLFSVTATCLSTFSREIDQVRPPCTVILIFALDYSLLYFFHGEIVQGSL